LTGRTLDIEHRALPADDPVQRCPDITRARRLLGWEPAVALEDGLRRTIEYFRRLAEPASRFDVSNAVAAE
jgi:UDP-glucuronate decarboxylase